MSTRPSSPGPKNRLLALLRRWHLWGGVFAALFLVVFALTGAVLNYKGPILDALGLGPAPADAPPARSRPGAESSASAVGLFTTTHGLAAASVSSERALEYARAAWGEVPLERIELKAERDQLVWKLKRRGGAELLVDAMTGERVAKGQYERLNSSVPGGQPTRSVDWGKILLDLHTGKIGGELGKAVMTLAAGGLLFLTLSGLYLWLKPVLIRRTHARARAKQSPPQPNAVGSQPAEPSGRELVKA